jgi:hypothetical protein
VLLKNGEICETDCQCISERCAEPRPPDSGGQFPKRCIEGPGDGAACKGDGDTCADPGECCNRLCLPNPQSCGFSCGGRSGTGGTSGTGGGGTGGTGGGPCVVAGQACTAAGDCCTGLICLPDGRGGLFCGRPVPR